MSGSGVLGDVTWYAKEQPVDNQMKELVLQVDEIILSNNTKNIFSIFFFRTYHSQSRPHCTIHGGGGGREKDLCFPFG